jgi:hypothetical protein
MWATFVVLLQHSHGVPRENDRDHGSGRIVPYSNHGGAQYGSVNSTEKLSETLCRRVHNLNRIYEEVELLHYV